MLLVGCTGMAEATEYSNLGLNVTAEDLERIRVAFKRTYDDLAKTNKKWASTEFCKLQLVNLWDSVYTFVESSIQKEERLMVDSKSLRDWVKLNSENEQFAEILAHYLKVGEAIHPLETLLKVETIQGSTVFRFNDRVRNTTSKVKCDLRKLWRVVDKQSVPVINSLRKFVDWAIENKRTLVTGALVAGVIVVTTFSFIWAGAAVIELAKLVLPFVISTVCLVASMVSYSKDGPRMFERIMQKLGMTFLS
jgi:hypothetical protein